MRDEADPALRERWKDEHRAATAEVRGRVEASLAALEAWCGREPELLAFRPGPGRWSAAEVLEHVALANRYLLVVARKIRDRSLRRLERGLPWPAAPPRLGPVAALARRDLVWPHPAHMAPAGALLPAGARRLLARARREAAGLLEEMPAGEGTLHRIRMSRVPGDDRLDLVQYVDVLARHAERHLAQLEDNQAALERA